MKSNILNRPEIKNLLKRFVLVSLYTDGEEPEQERNQKYQELKFGTVAIPLYAIVDQNERVLGVSRGLTRDVAIFKKFLTDALAVSPGK